MPEKPCPEVILGIETSCDDTCAAVVVKGHHVLSSARSSQDEVHAEFGGVVPELAARKHIENLPRVVSLALRDAGLHVKDMEGIAVSNRYGLASSLFVGVAMAKAFAYGRGIPLIGINHVEGHLYSVLLEHPELPFPYISLTVAGGHTLLILVREPFTYNVLGQSIDDAIGEAYDKVARHLGLDYPGGPAIDKLARQHSGPCVNFTSPMIKSGDYQFSFSGIKTAVRYYVDRLGPTERKEQLSAIAAGFQEAVVKVLVKKALTAAEEFGVKTITLSGGVAANSAIREKLKEAAGGKGITVYWPSLSFCTDNAAMIAGLGYHKFLKGERDDFSMEAHPEPSLS